MSSHRRDSRSRPGALWRLKMVTNVPDRQLESLVSNPMLAQRPGALWRNWMSCKLLYGWSTTISCFSFLQIGLWTLPATALFVCNCLKLERLNSGTSINAWDEPERIDIKALEVLVFTLLLHLEVWALVETVDLVIEDSQQQLVAPAARLIPAEFTQHFSCFLQFRAKTIFIIHTWTNVDSRVKLLPAQYWNPELELFWKPIHPFGISPNYPRSTCWKDFEHHRVQVHQRQ